MHRRSFAFATVIAAGLTAVATGGGAVAAPSSRHAAAAEARAAALGRRAAPVRPGRLRHDASALGAGAAGRTAAPTTPHAQTTFPSDSFPGMVAQLTGGGPGTTGIFYDDTYNRRCCRRARRDCSTATRGTEVVLDRGGRPLAEPDHPRRRPRPRRAGAHGLPTNTLQQTLADAPAITKAILTMTPTPQSLLDPAALPVDPATCLPVYPHHYLRVNTVFEVAREPRAAHRVVGQAPRLRDPQRPVGHRHPGPVHPRDQQRRRQRRRRLDDRQRAHPGVRQHQGRRGAQRDRRLDHSGTRTRRHAGDLRHELPDASPPRRSCRPRTGWPAATTRNGTPGPLLPARLDYVDAQVGA